MHFYYSTIEHSPLPMAVVEGPDYVFHSVNPPFCKLVGRNCEDLVRQKLADVMPEAEKLLSLLERVYRTGEPETLLEWEQAGEQPVYWSYGFWPVSGGDESKRRIVIQVVDTTESTKLQRLTLEMNEALMVSAVRQHEAAEELQRARDELELLNADLLKKEKNLERLVDNLARSNRDLQQFAYIASHDLQEPLRQITSFVQLLEERYSHCFDQTAREYFAFVVEGTQRMQGLVLNLLEYSRVTADSRNPEPVPVQAALEDALRNLSLLIEQSNATITWDDLPTVNADESQLAQVFQNLIGNAIKFRGSADPVIHVGVERRQCEWVFSVRDNGIGFSQIHAERIFQLFQRLHHRDIYMGTGIGLTICKQIIERHGGRIWAQSEPGKGSTFYFTLPAGETAPTA